MIESFANATLTKHIWYLVLYMWSEISRAISQWQGFPEAHSTCPHLWLFSHSQIYFFPGYFFFLMHGDKRLGWKGKEFFFIFFLITLQSPTLEIIDVEGHWETGISWSSHSIAISECYWYLLLEFLGPGNRGIVLGAGEKQPKARLNVIPAKRYII